MMASLFSLAELEGAGAMMNGLFCSFLSVVLCCVVLRFVLMAIHPGRNPKHTIEPDNAVSIAN